MVWKNSTNLSKRFWFDILIFYLFFFEIYWENWIFSKFAQLLCDHCAFSKCTLPALYRVVKSLVSEFPRFTYIYWFHWQRNFYELMTILHGTCTTLFVKTCFFYAYSIQFCEKWGSHIVARMFKIECNNGSLGLNFVWSLELKVNTILPRPKEDPRSLKIKCSERGHHVFLQHRVSMN